MELSVYDYDQRGTATPVVLFIFIPEKNKTKQNKTKQNKTKTKKIKRYMRSTLELDRNTVKFNY